MGLGLGEETARKCWSRGRNLGMVPASRPIWSQTRQRRLPRGRVDDLIKMRSQSTTETAFDGGSVVDNVEDNRIQIFFDAKPRMMPCVQSSSQKAFAGAEYWRVAADAQQSARFSDRKPAGH